MNTPNPFIVAGAFYCFCQTLWREPANWIDLAAFGFFLSLAGIESTLKTWWSKKGTKA